MPGGAAYRFEGWRRAGADPGENQGARHYYRAEDRKASDGGLSGGFEAGNAAMRRGILGISWSKRPDQAPDPAGGLSGYEEGGKGFSVAPGGGAAFAAQGLRRESASEVWGYSARAEGLEPQQPGGDYDIRHGG